MPTFNAYSPKMQFLDDAGNPLADGTVTFYEAGSEELADIYDGDGNALSNPAALDSRGECAIRLETGHAYKVVLKDADGATIWSVDDVNWGDTAETLDSMLSITGDSYITVTQAVSGEMLVVTFSFDDTTLTEAIDSKQDAVTAGTGLEFSGATLNHSNSVEAATSYVGNAYAVPRIQYDSEGHITAATTERIFPPTTVGNSGQVWESDGTGVGNWSDRLTNVENTIESLEDSMQYTITAGTGLEFSGATLNHSNSVEAATSYVGSATAVPRIQYDSEGHITAATTATIYPPTTVGTSGQVWVSDGSDAGAWSDRLTTAEESIVTNTTNIATNTAAIESLEDSKQDAVTAGTGLEFSGATLNHSNSVEAATSYVGSATAVPRIQYDSEGHITAATTATIYPPTTVGTSGQVWVSDGSGAGAWSDRLTELETAVSESPHSAVLSHMKSCSSSNYTITLQSSTSISFSSTYTTICPWNVNASSWEYLNVYWPVQVFEDVPDTLLTCVVARTQWSSGESHYGIKSACSWYDLDNTTLNSDYANSYDGFRGVMMTNLGSSTYSNYRLWGPKTNDYYDLVYEGEPFFIGRTDYSYGQCKVSLFGHAYGGKLHILLVTY